jgi:hypothetical protein
MVTQKVETCRLIKHFNTWLCPLFSYVTISQIAIISLYSVNELVFITETECLLRGTDCRSAVCRPPVASLYFTPFLSGEDGANKFLRSLTSALDLQDF